MEYAAALFVILNDNARCAFFDSVNVEQAFRERPRTVVPDEGVVVA